MSHGFNIFSLYFSTPVFLPIPLTWSICIRKEELRSAYYYKRTPGRSAGIQLAVLRITCLLQGSSCCHRKQWHTSNMFLSSATNSYHFLSAYVLSMPSVVRFCRTQPPVRWRCQARLRSCHNCTYVTKVESIPSMLMKASTRSSQSSNTSSTIFK